MSPYDTPILEYLPTAKANTKTYLNVRGAYYDVGVGPKGLETSFMPDGHGIPCEGNRMFLGQKRNGAFSAVNMFMRFRHTHDRDYALRVYLFLIEGEIEVNNQILKARDAMGVTDFDVFDIKIIPKSKILLVEVPMNQT